jgi:hypothetical protein
LNAIQISTRINQSNNIKREILKNLQQGNLETGQIFSSEAEQNLEILESWTKSGNISALIEALADRILENQTES